MNMIQVQNQINLNTEICKANHPDSAIHKIASDCNSALFAHCREMGYSYTSKGSQIFLYDGMAA